MSILVNAIIAASYSVLALAAALLLPAVLPQLTPLYGAVAGIAIFVGGLVLQFGLIMRQRGRQFSYQLEGVHRQILNVAGPLLLPTGGGRHRLAAEDRHTPAPGRHCSSSHMIAVLVGQEDGRDLFRLSLAKKEQEQVILARGGCS